MGEEKKWRRMGREGTNQDMEEIPGSGWSRCGYILTFGQSKALEV